MPANQRLMTEAKGTEIVEALEEIVEQAGNIAQVTLLQEAAAESAEDSEAWAVGERNGVPVTTGDPTYHNNAKYWSDQAQEATIPIASTSTLGGIKVGNNLNITADGTLSAVGGGGGGATSLSGLDDVSLSSIQNNQALMYDSATSKWKNKTIAISNVDGLQSELTAKASKSTVDGILDGTSIDSFGDVETALAGKVDKVAGKGLSKNDYTNADKAIVDGVTTALAGKQDSLANQTAYTSQGDATHVPQITTNNLGQVTGISQVAITHPTVDQSYNGSSSNAQSGTAVASAISGKANTSQLDSWTSAVSYASSAQTFTFTSLNDSYAYDIYCSRPNVSVTNIAKTGSGTSVQLVYTVSGAQSGDTAKLRIVK